MEAYRRVEARLALHALQFFNPLVVLLFFVCAVLKILEVGNEFEWRVGRKDVLGNLDVVEAILWHSLTRRFQRDCLGMEEYATFRPALVVTMQLYVLVGTLGFSIWTSFDLELALSLLCVFFSYLSANNDVIACVVVDVGVLDVKIRKIIKGAEMLTRSRLCNIDGVLHAASVVN